MKKLKNYVAIAAALIMTALCTVTAYAEGTLEISTPYPGISAKAGDSVSFNLDFNNNTDQMITADISVASIPDGWTGYIQGNSKEINSICLDPGTTESAATLNIDIPEDTEDGQYKISVKAVSGAVTNVLNLSITVKALQLGGNTISTDYTDQEGTTDTTYSFATTITNNSAEDLFYNFDASLPDKGWQISYKPSGESTQVSGITVPARSQQVMNISITPSMEAAAGTYEIPLKAISSSGTLEDTFEITLKGKYSVVLTTADGNLNIETTANKKTAVTLNINNTGNIDLENINLTSQTPEGWTFEYSESTIDLLEAGATKEITAYITPSSDAMNGDYITLLSAASSEASATTQFRITVKTETVWGIVGVVLIVIALGGLALIFKKYGRR